MSRKGSTSKRSIYAAAKMPPTHPHAMKRSRLAGNNVRGRCEIGPIVTMAKAANNTQAANRQTVLHGVGICGTLEIDIHPRRPEAGSRYVNLAAHHDGSESDTG